MPLVASHLSPSLLFRSDTLHRLGKLFLCCGGRHSGNLCKQSVAYFVNRDDCSARVPLSWGLPEPPVCFSASLQRQRCTHRPSSSANAAPTDRHPWLPSRDLKNHTPRLAGSSTSLEVNDPTLPSEAVILTRCLSYRGFSCACYFMLTCPQCHGETV